MSAVDSTVTNSLHNSSVSKFSLSVISTTAAYILVPVAFHYAVGDLNKALVLAIVAVWALSLTRMWGEVISLTAQAMAKIPVPAVVAELATVLPILPVLDPVVGAAI